jgi:hypothetical protein
MGNPTIAKLRMVHSLIDQAKDDSSKDAEARILFEQVKNELRAATQGAMPPAAPEQVQGNAASQLLPLIQDGSRATGGGRVQDQEANGAEANA